MTEVAIANSLFASAEKLAANDKARVFDFLGKFQANPRAPGLHLEKLNAAAPGIRSARISRGLRAILYSEEDRFVALYAGSHDDAYAWAERRRVARHPKTGVLQIVETAEEVERKLREDDGAAAQAPLFPADRFEDDYLLSLGLPESWLSTIRLLHSGDGLLEVLEKLPEEVGERLLDLATGKIVTPPTPVPPTAPLSDSPDNLRRFWVVGDTGLAEQLAKPLEAWMHFLHPSQRELASRDFNGPVKVTGSAGTGKTVVAMHRARNLAGKGQRVLLTSFVTTLCRNLERNLHSLCSDDELARIRVSTVHAEALRMVRRAEPEVHPVEGQALRKRLDAVRRRTAPELDASFVAAEWEAVVAPHGISRWEEYRDVERRGRGKPLSTVERKRLWTVFDALLTDLLLADERTWQGFCRRALEMLQSGEATSPYDAVIVDEVQDLRPIEIRFLAALAKRGSGGPLLTLVGDAGQRIYPGGFSLRSLGIETRGRSRVLRINYRTTAQIRRAADRLLCEECDDLNGGTEHRDGTRSLLRGPTPSLRGFASEQEEAGFVTNQIQQILGEGLSPEEIAVFARTGGGLDAFESALAQAEVPSLRLARRHDDNLASAIQLATLHRAKGLEFKAVFLARCCDGRVPLQSVIRRIDDPADRKAALDRERNLLYVGLTRARDQAFVTWSGQPSAFLEPLLEGPEEEQP